MILCNVTNLYDVPIMTNFIQIIFMMALQRSSQRERSRVINPGPLDNSLLTL